MNGPLVIQLSGRQVYEAVVRVSVREHPSRHDMWEDMSSEEQVLWEQVAGEILLEIVKTNEKLKVKSK